MPYVPSQGLYIMLCRDLWKGTIRKQVVQVEMGLCPIAHYVGRGIGILAISALTTVFFCSLSLWW